MNPLETKKAFTKHLGIRFDPHTDRPLGLAGLRVFEMKTHNLNLEHADLTNTTFANCDYRNIRFDGTLCNATVFKKCHISSLYAFNTDLRGVKFIDTELKQFTFENCLFDNVTGLEGVQLARATLINCTFINTKLTNAKLDSAYLSNVKFQKCDLQSTDLSHSRCINVEFDQDCTLKRSRWWCSYVKDSDFSYAECQYINFYGANILNTHFQSTDLSECSLRESFITNCDFDYSDVKGIQIWNTTFDPLAFKLALNKTYYLDKEIFWRYHPGVKYEKQDLDENTEDEYVTIPQKGAN